MDPSRFDSLTRTITSLSARRPTRRALLPILSGLLTVGLATVPEAEAKKRKRRRHCRGHNKGKTFCRGRGGCQDLRNDPLHCGGCGRECGADETCQNGSCRNTTCTPNCVTALCGDDDGCGGICRSGSCPPGKTCGVNGTCVTDSGCNPPCGFNQVCRNGACAAAPDRCPTAFVCQGDPLEYDPPVCGRVAGTPGGECGCHQTTEGNNVCLNETDAKGRLLDPTLFVACTSSQECWDTAGFHFYCLKPLANQNGTFCVDDVGRCWPECDNPSV